MKILAVIKFILSSYHIHGSAFLELKRELISLRRVLRGSSEIKLDFDSVTAYAIKPPFESYTTLEITLVGAFFMNLPLGGL